MISKLLNKQQIRTTLTLTSSSDSRASSFLWRSLTCCLARRHSLSTWTRVDFSSMCSTFNCTNKPSHKPSQKLHKITSNHNCELDISTTPTKAVVGACLFTGLLMRLMIRLYTLFVLYLNQWRDWKTASMRWGCLGFWSLNRQEYSE